MSLAVGTMVGASIFSIFGLGARVAGHSLPLVFVLSGLLALCVAYSYAMLGSRIVSNAGPMEFIIRGMGDNLVTGALSILNWFTYVVSIALFARGFVGYLLPAVGWSRTGVHDAIAMGGVIGVFTVIGALGSWAVSRAERIIVAAKLTVLGVFVAFGIWTVRGAWIVPDWSGLQSGQIFDAVALFFLSYMGFGLVTNASEDMENPQRDVPRAIYGSIFLVTIIYVLVAVVAVGNLPLAELARAEDFALAEAAKPFLGRFGYTLVTVGALFSISSALNATLMGGANVAYALARDGELPEVFRRRAWFGVGEGLYLTSGLGWLLAVAIDLNGIASMTSAVVMVIYLFVLASHYRLVPEYGGRRGFIVFSFLVIFVIFVVLMRYQAQTNRSAFYGTWAVLAGAMILEAVYRAARGRTFVPRYAARAMDRILPGQRGE